MTKEIKSLAILKAQEIINQMQDVAHSKSHMEQVLLYSKKISRDYPEVNSDVLDLAVWWHDTGKLYGDRGHAARSVEMAELELGRLGVDSRTISEVCIAIKEHSNSENLTPSTLEGKILKDADKLDFLTPSRWKVCIDGKIESAILVGIEKVPLIRNHILNLKESKKIFDLLLPKLKDFARSENSPFFAKYKEKIVDLKIEE